MYLKPLFKEKMLEPQRYLVMCLTRKSLSWGKKWHFLCSGWDPSREDTGCLCSEAALLSAVLQKRRSQHKILGDTGGGQRAGKFWDCFICCTRQVLPWASLWSPEDFYRPRGVRIIDFSTHWLNQKTGGMRGRRRNCFKFIWTKKFFFLFSAIKTRGRKTFGWSDRIF